MNALLINSSFLPRKLETAVVGEASRFAIFDRSKAGRFAYHGTGSPNKVYPVERVIRTFMSAPR